MLGRIAPPAPSLQAACSEMKAQDAAFSTVAADPTNCSMGNEAAAERTRGALRKPASDGSPRPAKLVKPL